MAVDHAVVVEPHQRDHVVDVGVGLDRARAEARPAREDRVVVDASLREENVPDVLRKAEVRDAVAVEVADLPPAYLEPELAAASRPRRDPRPRGDLLGDLARLPAVRSVVCLLPTLRGAVSANY